MDKIAKIPKSLRALVKKRNTRMSFATYCVTRIPGGSKAAFEVIRMFRDADPDAADICQVLDALDTVHGPAPSIEEIVEKAGVSAEDFLVLLTRLMVRLAVPTAHLTAAAMYPDIMEASVVKALDPEKGTDERRMHFEHAGFVQARGGIRIGIKNTNGSAAPDDPPGPGEAQNFDRTARSAVRNLPLTLPE